MVLARMQWEENEGYRHCQGFNPDKERYLAYEDAGCYFHFAAREEERLVGSGGVYIMPSMHSQQLISTEDTYYLLPEYRKGRNALRFFSFMEDFLLRKGVVEVCLTTPQVNTRAARIVEYMGYKPISTGWSKHLKDPSNVRTVTTAAA
jgi:hypothetical protein